MADHEITIDAAHAGLRLDLFLARGFSGRDGWTRSAIQKMIADGGVALNGRKAKAGYRLKPGDRIEVQPLPTKDVAIAPERLPLEILYEDADCIVLNKAPGMVVHPA